MFNILAKSNTTNKYLKYNRNFNDMKITFLNEAGPFGSYKKATTQSNIDNVKKELSKEAELHILEKRCDELAELYLDMLNEVNLKINEISNKYKYEPRDELVARTGVLKWHKVSDILELSNYIANKYLAMSKRKEMQLNLIKNMYCNKPAIEYMLSHGCFILPVVDTTRRGIFFGDSEEIIPYKNMTKSIAIAAEKVIKSHLSKFPSYASSIPNKVKIIILQNDFSSYLDFNSLYRSSQEQEELQLFSYMGITKSGVDFEYPGHGSSCLNYILDNYIITRAQCNITLKKSNEAIWKAIADPSPWMFNKIIFNNVYTDLYTVSADNFYGIKLLKFALDKGILSKEEYSRVRIVTNDVIKNIKSIPTLKQKISNNGLDDIVIYCFNDMHIRVDSLTVIGKEITPKQAEQEGIEIDDIKRRVYEFDYNNASEVKSAAKNIINTCYNFLTDANIKKMVEDKIEEYLPVLMNKVLESKPYCVSSSNKILLCDYYRNSQAKCNIRIFIDTKNKVEINKKGNLVFYIAIDFKLPVRGVNPNYSSRPASQNNHGKNYEYITGKKIKIEIPL